MTTAAASPNPPRGPRRQRPRAVGIGEIVGWFAGVVCAYWLYWLIAVPLIEPGIEPQATSYASDNDVRAAREAKSARKLALARYFPAGSWELANPAIWETDQTLLLFKGVEPLDDGKVKLNHCTLLYFPDARGEADDPRSRPIIMRASEGATLKFDQPIVLRTVDPAKRKLIGGHLNGLITIRREPSSPSAGDDLLITSRDIELKDDRAFSPHPVDFRLGRSKGSGRDLEIQLAADDGRPGGGFRTGKVRALLLKRDVKVKLVLDDPALARRRRAAAEPQLAGSTLDIKCQGAFRYDFDRHAASFHDQVDVVRSSTGPVDLLNCQVLTVFLHQRGATQPQGTQPADQEGVADATRAQADLPIRKIEARGDPVILQSPARGMYLNCREGLEFEPIAGDPLGRFAAVGPGVMQGVTPGDDPRKYLVQWTQQVRFEPAEAGLYVVSLTGGPKVGVANLGEITAYDRLDKQGRLLQQGHIVTWVRPIQAPGGREPIAHVQPVSTGASSPIDQPPRTASTVGDKWQIERVRAEGNVVVDVPQLAGTTGKLEVSFDWPPGGVSGASTALASPQARVDTQPPARPLNASPRQPPAQRFSVRAGGVQAKLVPDGQRFAVTELVLYDQAHLEELTERPDQMPLIVDGERLQVADANTDNTHVTVAGQPAHLEGGGVVLLGEKIELARRTNHLWVGGPGRMIMPIEQDLNGRALAQPQTAEITWRGRMDFLANRVTYQGEVRVTSQHQLLTTAKLEGLLDRAINFSSPGALAPGMPASGGPSAPQLAFVRCYGETVLDSRQFDARGAKTSVDQMRVFDLSIDRASGDVNARGPGSVRHVGRESDGGPLARTAGPLQNRPSTNSHASRPGLVGLHVRFQTKVSGNLNRRELSFSDATETAYAPVADWNTPLEAEDPKSLGPQGLVLHAKQLTVREMPARVRNGDGWFELVAVGNVLAEGAQFVSLAHRATYSQDKDQLVLEGDGRSPAEISYTATEGGGRNKGKFDKITYLIGRQYISVSGAHSLGVEVLQPRRPAGK